MGEGRGVKVRLSDSITEDLRAKIIAGEIKANIFLAESEIAEQYGVSKAPAKAALQALSHEGYLICYPRKGYMVASVSVNEYEYVRELRAHLEQLSVRMAIQRASDAEIESLRDIIHSGPEQHNPFKTNNTRFHLRLAEISQNPCISAVLLKYLGLTSRYAFMENVDDSFHEDIIEAMVARDVERALGCLEMDLNPLSPRYRRHGI